MNYLIICSVALVLSVCCVGTTMPGFPIPSRVCFPSIKFVFAWLEYGICDTVLYRHECIDIGSHTARNTDNYEFSESSKCPYFQFCSFLRHLNCLLSFGAHWHFQRANREAWGSRSRTPTVFFFHYLFLFLFFSFFSSNVVESLSLSRCAKIVVEQEVTFRF